jgi:hypothetical protein
VRVTAHLPAARPTLSAPIQVQMFEFIIEAKAHGQKKR